MGIGCRGNFIATSRAELIEHYAMDLFEEFEAPTKAAYDTLNDDQRAICFDALRHGVKVACAALGETSTYEEEYQALAQMLRSE